MFTQATNYLFETPVDEAVCCNDKHMGSAVLLPQQLDRAAAGTQGKVQSHQGRRTTAASDGLWDSLPHVSQSCRDTSGCRGTSSYKAQQHPGHISCSSDSGCCQPAVLPWAALSGRVFCCRSHNHSTAGLEQGSDSGQWPLGRSPSSRWARGTQHPGDHVHPAGSARALAGLPSSTIATGHLGHR